MPNWCRPPASRNIPKNKASNKTEEASTQPTLADFSLQQAAVQKDTFSSLLYLKLTFLSMLLLAT